VIFDAERQGEETLGALRPFIEEMYEGVDVPALVVIGAEREEWLREALRAGLVQAALPGAASSGEIISAVVAVSNGLIALDAETFAAVLSPATSAVDDLTGAQPYDERLPSVEPVHDALTPREREVLEMLAEGLSNKEIAWRMKISEHTVKFHIASIFGKLGASTRTEAVMQGIRQGLVMM
jgi:DNA-binding NarL/FixJ family response regulator